MNAKRLLNGALLLGALLMMRGPAWAGALEDLELKRFNVSYYVLRSSGGVGDCMNLFYVGSASEAVVTVTSTTILAYAPAGTADSNFGTSGGYDMSAASYDTVGELCAAIDKLADYECRLTGCEYGINTNRLRDQTAASGTNDLKANRGFTVQTDTAPINGGGNFTSAFEVRVGRKPIKGRRVTLKSCTVNAAGTTPSFRVFGAPKYTEGDGHTYDTQYEVYRSSFDGGVTQSSFTFHSAGIGGLDFALDAQVAVGAGYNNTIQAGTNFLDCWFEER